MQSLKKGEVERYCIIYCILHYFFSATPCANSVKYTYSAVPPLMYHRWVNTRRLSGLKKRAAGRCTGLAGHCFYWAAVLFFLYKASCCCFCSAGLSSDANSHLRTSKDGSSFLLAFLLANMTGYYCEIITLLSFPFLILHLHSDSRSVLPLLGQAFGSRDCYFSSSSFMGDIYSWGHIVLVLATRHLMRLAQPLGHVFVAFTCRWKFSDSP